MQAHTIPKSLLKIKGEGVKTESVAGGLNTILLKLYKNREFDAATWANAVTSYH